MEPSKQDPADSGMESGASVSGSSINDIEDPILRRKVRVFYSDYADGEFRFENSKVLKVSRALLALESGVLDRLFRESVLENIIQITDFDFDAFHLFLDCLMGFKKISVSEALSVFPIAWNFKTEKFIEECLNVLRPVKLHKSVCLTLNLALRCECEELKKRVLRFLATRFGYSLMLFHDEKYYFLLEPESVVELLKNKLVKFDSYNLLNIFKWGLNHVTKNNISMDLKAFFVEKGIAQFLTVDCFETKGAFYDLYKTEVGKNYFTFNDYEYVAENPKFKNGYSFWEDMKAGDVLIEKFRVKNVPFLENYETSIITFRNSVVVYKLPKNRSNIFMKGEYSLKVLAREKQIIKAEEKRVLGSKDPERFKFVLKVNLNAEIISDVEIEIKRTFFANCRILKSTPLNFEPLGSAKNTYFTYSATFKPEKKFFLSVPS